MLLFAEAKYAFQLNKRIVPLKLQGNYKADGWLGILCGDKLYFDFSEEDRFQKSIASLFKELGDQGKLIKDQDQCIDKTSECIFNQRSSALMPVSIMAVSSSADSVALKICSCKLCVL